MRRRLGHVAAAATAVVMLCAGLLAGSASAAVGGAAGSPATSPPGTWGKEIEVPGTASLNAGGYAAVNSVSCASAGNCSVGGYYKGALGHRQAFVASEVSGAWAKAIEVPGTAALNAGGYAAVNSVSCASAGNCAAGGYYEVLGYRSKAFVASEVSGAWGKAIEVPGTASLNTGGYAAVNSVSCASAGNCAAGGYYEVLGYRSKAFVASEVGGAWGKAIEVPGTASLNTGGYAAVNSVSCASAGNCSVGGYYKDTLELENAFVASEVSGVWGKAIEVPGTASLNTGGYAQVRSVSCASAGNCSIGGYYHVGSYSSATYSQQAFVASEVNGVWAKAIEVPGTAAVNAGAIATVTSVSCASAGNCSIGGYYNDTSYQFQPFVASEVSGAWGKAIEVPGVAALSGSGFAKVRSVSCASAGDCAAGGYYTDSSGYHQAFVVGETPVARLAVATTSLPAGTAGTAYSTILLASGGTLPCTWSLAPGSAKLPAGLRLSAGGKITGTPAGAGTTTVTVQVSDSGAPQQTATRALSITIKAAVRQPDLNISLHPRGVFRHGRNATYRVRVHNAGNATARREKVVVHLPSGMTRPHAHGTGWACRSHGRRVVCVHRGHLRPRRSATFYLRIHITARKGRRLTTRATVTPAGSDTNNTARSTVRVR